MNDPEIGKIVKIVPGSRLGGPDVVVVVGRHSQKEPGKTPPPLLPKNGSKGPIPPLK